MAKPLPTIDPKAFAARLQAAADKGGVPAGRGRGTALAAAYHASKVTANAWLNGAHMPSPDRVLAMADDFGVDFMSLYFGRPGDGRRPRWDASTIEGAMFFLDELDRIAGHTPAARPSAARLAIACEVVSEGEIVDGQSVVVRLADRLRRQGANDGDGSGQAAEAGAADGGAHGHRGKASTKVAAGRRR